MRHTIFLFLLLPAFLWGQYPNNPRKLRLGTQTTGAGLTYIQSGAPSHTPADDEDAWMVLDTTNNVLYYYDEAAGAWENILDDVVRDTVFRITSVPDTSTIVPLQGDLFINATADTLGAYDPVLGWQLFVGGGSSGTTHDTTAYFHRRLTFGNDYTLPSAVLDTADVISIYAGAQIGSPVTITLPTLSDTTNDGKIIYVMGSGTENGDIMRITSPDSTDILVQGCGAGSVTGPDTIRTSYRVLYQYIISNGRYYRTCQRPNVNSITSVPDTTNIDAHQGDMFVNSTADTLGLYSGTGWVLFYGGGGIADGDYGDVTVSGSGATWTIDANGNSMAADGTDTLDFGSKAFFSWVLDVNAVEGSTLVLANPVQWGQYLIHIKNTAATDTVVFPDNLISVIGDTLGSRCFTSDAMIPFYYDGTNYISSGTIGTACQEESNPDACGVSGGELTLAELDTVGMSSEYKAVLEYGETNSYGLPSQCVADAQDSLLTDLKTAGAWAGMDAFYCFATNGDSLFALINWVSPGTNNSTLSGAGTLIFTANKGYLTDGTASYINTNYNPSTEATNFAQDDAGIIIYNYVADSTSYAGIEDVATVTATGFNGTAVTGKINSSSTSMSVSSSADNLHQVYRSASNNINVYAGGTLSGTSNQASTGVPNGEIYIGARSNSGPSAEFFNAFQVSIFAVSDNQSSNAADIDAAIDNYFNSL